MKHFWVMMGVAIIAALGAGSAVFLGEIINRRTKQQAFKLAIFWSVIMFVVSWVFYFFKG